MALEHDLTMDALMLQLVTWVTDRPRTYGEAMDAWKTSCPRMPVWEDAVSNGLVRIEGTGRMRERSVRLTQQGRALLDAQARPAHRSTNTGAAPSHRVASSSSCRLKTKNAPPPRTALSRAFEVAVACSG